MMTLTIWDVQHGSAAYLKTPSGKHIVIDLGTGKHSNKEETFSPLLHLNKNYGVKQLDEVIITHPHTDHIDDIMNFDLLSPKVLARPKHLSEADVKKANPGKDQKKTDKYLEIDRRYSFPLRDLENPQLAENNGGVNIKTFVATKCGTSNINNHSVVTVIEYLGIKIMIPGDNEASSWKELLEKESFVNAIKNTDIFVASHHGRESGYYSGLFEHFRPQLVIVSDKSGVETSVTERYSNIATGYHIYKRSEHRRQSYIRKCLTTRNDGMIIITVEKDHRGTNMDVTIN